MTDISASRLPSKGRIDYQTQHHCQIFNRSQHHHTTLYFHSLLCLHTPTERRGAQEQPPFLWEMKGRNVCWGQTSKTMVSHRGEGVSDQRQQRIPFMAQGSGARLSSASLCCTVPLYGRLQVSLIPELRESTTVVDLYVVQYSAVKLTSLDNIKSDFKLGEL